MLIFGRSKKDSGKSPAIAKVQKIKNLYDLPPNHLETKKSKKMPKNDEVDKIIPTKNGSFKLFSRKTGVAYDIMASLSDTKKIMNENK